MPLVILCSGQGGQHPDMFALTGAVPGAQSLFEHAAELLGTDPRDFVRRESGEALHRNRAGQILCTLQALAAAAALGDGLSGRSIIAGYSVGELSAWGLGGLFSPTETLDLVARRAEAMDAATKPGDGLMFLRGLARPEIDRLCRRHGAAVAIVNPGGAYVLGGSGQSLRAIAAEAAAKAERILNLPVEVASHTRCLAGASLAFREALRRVSVRPATVAGERVLNGIDGSPVISVAEGLDKLAAQISHTVQWASCLESCVEAGATAFLELGPGHALSVMAGRAYPAIPARSLEDFKSLSGARGWLLQH